MASLRLNIKRSMVAVPSDTIDIPSIMNEAFAASTTTATTANKLVDSTKDFTAAGIKIGDIIQNHTDATKATITAIDSATTLSISADIMAISESYSIYTEATRDCYIYVGIAGDIKVTTSGGDDVIIPVAQVGWHPMNIKRLWATGTTELTGFRAGW